jgi:hypothetical protein
MRGGLTASDSETILNLFGFDPRNKLGANVKQKK